MLFHGVSFVVILHPSLSHTSPDVVAAPRKDDDVGDIANEDSDDEVPETLAPGVGGDVDSETDDGVDADGDDVDAMAVDAV